MTSLDVLAMEINASASKWWHRVPITIVAMIVVGYVSGRLWFAGFGVRIPADLAGVIGGLAAIPVWEPMRWVDARDR